MAEPTVGRCGHQLGRPPFGGMSPVCALPASHAGWHRSDEGTEWGIPAADPYNALLKREKDIYDRGVAAGRRQAAEELMSQVGNTTGDQTPDQIRWFALEVLNDIAEGAPAEPVEEATDGR